MTVINSSVVMKIIGDIGVLGNNWTN